MSDRGGDVLDHRQGAALPHPMRIAGEFTVATPTDRAAQYGQGLLEDVAAHMFLRWPKIVVVRERQAREP